MITVLDYMLKLSACYAAAYLFYKLVLSKLTSYKSNRFYLLFTSLLAFVFPLIKLDVLMQPETIGRSAIINKIPALNLTQAANEIIPVENSDNISFIITSIFIAGVVICLVHFILQLLSFKKLTAKASLLNTQFGIKLYQLDMDVMPFSFGNAIYLNQQKHTVTELDDIIKHESVHVHQQHTIDVIIAEIICMLNWYNPFAWLIKGAIKQNLEYLADDTVINEGADKKTYQYLLLKVTGYSPLTIASSFKLSSLKQRIYMMNKTKTSQRHLLKLLFVLPIIAFMMVAFRNDAATHTMQTNINATEDTYMLSELRYNISDISIDQLVKGTQDKSLLQVGKPFTISIIKNERDRLKTLLEKNGYSNINSNAISFLIDSTLTNNKFAIQVNIDLKRRTVALKKSNKQTNNIIAASTKDHIQTVQDNRINISTVATEADKKIIM